MYEFLYVCSFEKKVKWQNFGLCELIVDFIRILLTIWTHVYSIHQFLYNRSESFFSAQKDPSMEQFVSIEIPWSVPSGSRANRNAMSPSLTSSEVGRFQRFYQPWYVLLPPSIITWTPFLWAMCASLIFSLNSRICALSHSSWIHADLMVVCANLKLLINAS